MSRRPDTGGLFLDAILCSGGAGKCPWWFETGTPTFVVDVLTERGFLTPRLARLRSDEALISTFDVQNMPSEALLWQTGDLTITGSRQIGAGWGHPDPAAHRRPAPCLAGLAGAGAGQPLGGDVRPAADR